MKRLIICLLTVLIVMVGCSADTVYDDDEQIARNSNTYNLTNSRQKQVNQKISGTISSFSGMGTVWKYKAPADDTMELDYSLKITKGKVKVVHIAPDGALTVLAEVTEDDDPMEQAGTIEIPVQKGQNRIKLVAQGAALQYSMEIPKGQMATIGGSD